MALAWIKSCTKLSCPKINLVCKISCQWCRLIYWRPQNVSRFFKSLFEPVEEEIVESAHNIPALVTFAKPTLEWVEKTPIRRLNGSKQHLPSLGGWTLQGRALMHRIRGVIFIRADQVTTLISE